MFSWYEWGIGQYNSVLEIAVDILQIDGFNCIGMSQQLFLFSVYYCCCLIAVGAVRVHCDKTLADHKLYL